MRNGYGRGSYRGRSSASRVLKIIIIILILVLVLAVAAVLYLGQFRVYSSDGLRLDIPFLTDRATPPPQPDPNPPGPTPTLVIVTPAPTPPPQLHIAALPREALAMGAAQAQIQAAGANAAWFDMKADDGTLGYVSALPLALQAKASSANPALNEAIKALNAAEDVYTVARVSCFKDNSLSTAEKSLNILTNSGYQWTDPQKLKWSSPTNPAVRAYVAAICGELAGLGFDEIVLDNAGYPTTGNLTYIKKGPNYNLDQLDEIITGFYAEVRAALAPYPEVTLSIVTTEGALDGTDKLSGQTAANVAQSADRVWAVPPVTVGTSYAQLLSAAGMSQAAEQGVIVSLAPIAGDLGDSWAVWP